MWFKRVSAPVISKSSPCLLPLPPLLIELMEAGRWQQPCDAKIQSVIPFLEEPVDFVRFVRWSKTWEFETQVHVADDPLSSALFQEYRGSKGTEHNLPWLDAEKALFIAVNREPGADLGIALDYRTDIKDPRVVASDWWAEGNRKCNWRQVTERFSDFVQKLDL